MGLLFASLLLATLIVVAVGSMLARHDFYGGTARSPSPSVPAEPNITTHGGGAYIIGGAIRASATLSGGQSPSGNITFALYPSLADCKAGTEALFSDTVLVNGGNGTYSSNSPFKLTSADTYYWHASYSGDGNNRATGACGYRIEVGKPSHETADRHETTASEDELKAPPTARSPTADEW